MQRNYEERFTTLEKGKKRGKTEESGNEELWAGENGDDGDFIRPADTYPNREGNWYMIIHIKVPRYLEGMQTDRRVKNTLKMKPNIKHFRYAL